MKIFLFVAAVLSCGCTSFDNMSRDVMHETRKYNRKPILVAVNQDSIQRFFVLNADRRFYYCEGPLRSRNRHQKFYAGSYVELGDTLHLIFHKDYKPENMMPYMIRDSFGKYLIYPFKSGDLKTYLEISRTK